MKANRGQIEKALDAPPADIRFFLLYGPDEAGSAALGKRLERAMGPEAERVDLDGPTLRDDPARLADEAASFSMFGDRRWVRVNGMGEESLAAVTALLEAEAAGNPVIATAGALKGTSKLLKLVLDSPRAMAFISYQPDAREAEQIAVAVAREGGLRLPNDLAKRIAAGRPYLDVEDVARRVSPGRAALEAMATAGAFGCFDIDRRQALWTAGAAAEVRPDRLPGSVIGLDAPTLPGMSLQELSTADLWATGVAPEGHPTRFLRDHLEAQGVVTSAGLADVASGSKVKVAGVVTHRQRPATAGGTMFINLEDETGLINVVCSLGCWNRHRRVARSAPALMIRGRLERAEGVTNVIAERIDALTVPAAAGSRDFR